MRPPTLIAIGASAGGIPALRTLVAGLQAELPAAVCIVQHIGRHHSTLPQLLSKAGPLPATHAADGDALHERHIYIAPPDQHMLVVDGHLHLARGPRENFARPAIDPLFRTVAETAGPRAIGVILTGRLGDGTAGLYEIKRRGGIAVVQTPAEAEFDEMPRSALAHVDVDHTLVLADIAPCLVELVTRRTTPIEPARKSTEEAIEMTTDYRLHRPVALTCPGCGGSLERRELGSLVQYRCHIGHVYTSDAMATAQLTQLEAGVETALRLLNERIEVCRQMSEQRDAAAGWQTAMEEAEQRADAISELLSSGWTSPEAA